MPSDPRYSPYQSLAKAVAAAGSETCPACQKPVCVGDPQVQVNGCTVHAACARRGIYDIVPRPNRGAEAA